MPPIITPVLGKIAIGGIPLPVDPKKYLPQWGKRGTVFDTIWVTGDPGPGIKIQEYGRPPGGLKLRLESEDNFIDHPTVQAIDAMYETAYGVYTFTDWIGTIATVIFPPTAPGETPSWVFYPANLRGYDPEPGDLYRYTLDLRVITVTQWLGVARG